MSNTFFKPVPEDYLILGQDQYYSRDGKKTKLNENVIVVGASGAGKSRSIVRPNILQASGSYIISDPKGSLYDEMGPYLESKGYKVLCMDFIHPENSLRYDPFSHCKSTRDIQKLAHSLVYEMGQAQGRVNTYDPFWDKTSEIAICAIAGLLFEDKELSSSEYTILDILEILRRANRTTHGTASRGKSYLDTLMEDHEGQMLANDKISFAAAKYADFNAAPDKTYQTIIVCSLAAISFFDTMECRKMFSGNDIDFTSIGKEPTALFVKVSDTDRSMDMIVNVFYSQLMNELCEFADHCKGNTLPVPVRFILDDFATNARIVDFDKIISNIRSRGIAAHIMLQSESQLISAYGEFAAKTIVDNCNSYVYMGGTSAEQANIIGKRANKQMNTILNMPIGKSWIFRRGQEPVLCQNFDLEWFQKEKGFVPYEAARQTNTGGERDVA